MLAHQDTSIPPPTGHRQRWLSVLARAARDDLGAIVSRLQEVPVHTRLKGPESGTVMVEGRAGGSGSRFNLGEVTVTRCVVRLSSGTVGYAYSLGRDAFAVELAAIIDALLQEGSEEAAAAVEMIAEKQRRQKELTSRKAAATKVDFFTLVRGD